MMWLARLALWTSLGWLIAGYGITYQTIEFWAVLGGVYALEQIVWIQFADTLRTHYNELKRKHDNEHN
jgi:hypothetical protein